MTAARRERAALVATMREVGPDAPTLCTGWTTKDLAAHLVVRERRLDAAPGIMIGALAGYTDRVQRDTAAATDWESLLDLVASGPPLWSPFRLVDPIANMDEMFIHHEDVRRAQSDWQPRDLDGQMVDGLRRALSLMARLTLGKAPARIRLQSPDGTEVAAFGSGPELVVTGEIGELTLFVAGRDQTRLTFSDAQLLDVVRAARRGL